MGPLESRGDILREARKLDADLIAGRIGHKAWGRRTYLLNMLLGATKDTAGEQRLSNRGS